MRVDTETQTRSVNKKTQTKPGNKETQTDSSQTVTQYESAQSMAFPRSRSLVSTGRVGRTASASGQTSSCRKASGRTSSIYSNTLGTQASCTLHTPLQSVDESRTVDTVETVESIAVPTCRLRKQSLFANLYTTEFTAPVKDPESPGRSTQHQCKLHGPGCDRVVINVSGLRFETQKRTLWRLPHTLLGNDDRMREYWDPVRSEYFFDRHRPSFQAILFFYQSGGRLKRPYEVPPDVFLAELDFFELGEDIIRKFRKSDGFIIETVKTEPRNPLKKKISLLFNNAKSSKLAKVIAVISLLAITASVTALCVETLQEMREKYGCNTGKSHSLRNPFFVTETLCIVWFTIEYVARFYACPHRLRFVFRFLNIVDILAIVPYFVMLVMDQFLDDFCEAANYTSMFAILRCIRIVRIFKLSNYFTGLRVLAETIRASYDGFLTFILISVISVVVFSALMYHAEWPESDKYPGGSGNGNFHSIPHAFWYSIITMTTVGYGDMYPQTIVGKFVGAMCVIAGVLGIALTLPVITTNFTTLYARSTGRTAPVT